MIRISLIGAALLAASGVAAAKHAVLCTTGTPGKGEAEHWLNGLLKEATVVYTAKVLDKENLEKEKAVFKDEINVIKYKKVSAPAILADKICVTVSDE